MDEMDDRSMGLEEIRLEATRLASLAEAIGDFVSAALLAGVAAHAAGELHRDAQPYSTCH